ncbi:AAA family ATPase [Tumebacillus algifaecis]|uniref:AAA family ATPase n=1 Tax=Tumebacillus algifaecis TaxID=1214604 RepID=UPI0012FE73E5|nr:AAA family ATPase [Tumebacillus algifaecis]
MKLKSIRIKDVKRLHNTSISFYDKMGDKVRNRTIIVGKNGSGKTTLLEVIYGIAYLLEKGVRGIQDGIQDEEIIDFFSPGATEACFEYPVLDGTNQLLVRTGKAFQAFDKGPAPAVQDDVNIAKGDYVGQDRMPDCLVSRTESGRKFLEKVQIAAAGLEDRTPIGNVLYFPTDRFAKFSGGSGELVNEKPEFRWCYRFNRDQDEWKGSLESFLVWLYFHDLQREKLGYPGSSKFEEFKAMINRFLEGKRITTVNTSFKVEVIESGTNRTYGLEALSSGEKQVILLLGEIYRYISVGSLILIDEPEIHLHPVWQRIFIATLTDLCEKYDAQLILTTQSPEIAKSVMSSEVISLDNLLDESEVSANE